MPGFWPHARAAFVAFHLTAITLSALPTPEGGMSRTNWAEPTVQAEFAAWADRLGVDPQVFEERLWSFGTAYVAAYRKLLAPFTPYEELAGTDQSWKMFVAPHTYPTRFQIGARAGDGAWRVLYEEQSPTATWRRELLGRERLRSSIFRWGWSTYASSYGKGCVALAKRAFADEPSLTTVRCRMWKAKSPSPQEALAGVRPPGRWVYTRLVERSADGEVGAARKVADEAVGDAAGSSP